MSSYVLQYTYIHAVNFPLDIFPIRENSFSNHTALHDTTPNTYLLKLIGSWDLQKREKRDIITQKIMVPIGYQNKTELRHKGSMSTYMPTLGSFSFLPFHLPFYYK